MRISVFVALLSLCCYSLANGEDSLQTLTFVEKSASFCVGVWSATAQTAQCSEVLIRYVPSRWNDPKDGTAVPWDQIRSYDKNQMANYMKDNWNMIQYERCSDVICEIVTQNIGKFASNLPTDKTAWLASAQLTLNAHGSYISDSLASSSGWINDASRIYLHNDFFLAKYPVCTKSVNSVCQSVEYHLMITDSIAFTTPVCQQQTALPAFWDDQTYCTHLRHVTPTVVSSSAALHLSQANSIRMQAGSGLLSNCFRSGRVKPLSGQAMPRVANPALQRYPVQPVNNLASPSQVAVEMPPSQASVVRTVYCNDPAQMNPIENQANEGNGWEKFTSWISAHPYIVIGVCSLVGAAIVIGVVLGTGCGGGGGGGTEDTRPECVKEKASVTRVCAIDATCVDAQCRFPRATFNTTENCETYCCPHALANGEKVCLSPQLDSVFCATRENLVDPVHWPANCKCIVNPTENESICPFSDQTCQMNAKGMRQCVVDAWNKVCQKTEAYESSRDFE